MPKRTSAADATPVRVVIVTLDSHLASATERALSTLRRDLPGLSLRLHAAAEWGEDAAALERCRADIEQGDIILVTMLFMEDHIHPVLPWLQKRRDHCDAMICCMSAGEVIRLTRIGRFTMDGTQSGPLALLKRLRGGKDRKASAGAQQMAMLRREPQSIPVAVEEMIRWASPVSYFARRATRDTEIRGVRIAKGDRITMWYPSANRDEDVFPDPFRFDARRTPNEHVAFGGGGPHFCLGANLARREMITFFEELFRRTKTIEATGPLTYAPLGIFNSILVAPQSLPVRLA